MDISITLTATDNEERQCEEQETESPATQGIEA
jgi:hypothetical protein